MKQYWVLSESGAAEGPFPEPVVVQGLMQGRWNSTTPVCEVGREDWIPIASVQDIDFSGAEMATKIFASGAKGFRSAANTVSKLDREEIDAWLLLPAKLSEQTLRLLKRILSEAVFEWIAIAAGWVGLVAVPIGTVATGLAIVVMGLRNDRLSTFGWLFPAFLAMCFMQFVAARFSRESDVAVRQTSTDYSRGSVFDMLGLLLVGLGIWQTFAGFANAIDDSDRASLYLVWSVVGLLNIAMGGFFLHPASIGMNRIQSTTIGQDGIAVLSAIVRSALKAVRMSFGVVVTIGAAIAWYGAIAYLLDGESIAPIAWLTAGATLVAYGSLLPLLMYVVAMIAFMVIEAIDFIVGRDVRATRTGEEATGGVVESGVESAPADAVTTLEATESAEG